MPQQVVILGYTGLSTTTINSECNIHHPFSLSQYPDIVQLQTRMLMES